MSGTNKIVTSTVNVVSWEISRSSYEAAKKKILSLQQLTAKPVKALEQAQKRTAQSEGKAALAAAKAQTQRLKMAQKLSLEQQRQAQAQAKIAKQEEAHARKMQALNARGQAKQLSQQEQAARQSARLAAISEKVRAAARSGAATYNPDAPSIGREHYNPAVAARQNAQMMRGHGAVAADIAATKKAMALEEKRQREKEASLKRQSTAYDTLRRASLTISHIEGASLADKMKAVQAIKEATKGYSEQRYTIAEMRHELAKATLETRRQARINRQIIKDKAKVERAGRINAQRLTRERSERGYAGLAAAGVIGGAALVGSMGVSRVGQTLQGSLERSRDVKKLQQYGISNLEFAALQDLSMSRVGYSLSADKLADLNKDTTEKAGELLNTGSFKRNKKTGQVNFSGGGEFADIINNVLASTNGNQKVAQKVIGELQKLDFPTFITYLKQLQKTFKWTDNQTRHLAEAVNDGSVFLDVFNDEGKGLIDRMKKLSSEGWALSDSQQASLDKLSALSTEYSRVQTSLADHFSASFVAGLGEYGQNTDNLSKGMAGLIPITNELGKSFGEMASAILKITSWFGSINPENKHEQLSENGLYYKDSMVGRVWQSFKNAIEGVTSASTIPGVQGMPSQSYGSGTALRNAVSTITIPGFNSIQPQQPTFTVPTIESMTQRQPIPVSVTGQAEIKNSLDIHVNDGAINGLIDTKLRSYEQAQNNLILGISG
ncbi:TPA: chemotaxis protein [Escherichia coli]|uniref:chemotaxis protein n=1 Tax=Escherichia coli TaxID=562 RepID=UPI000CF1BC31|nr:chemotaxis protein [Escherichia coli]EFH7796630.1 chemotaxis protein [Escherichia coli]EFH7797800.1 chemotaxis protein [Escherichia coli]EHK2657068.1 chemotaxis protein [Escherichia coli]EHM4449166.1 chemotaxis protein [Escherichia coli]EID5517888.1 chemotaxis protein [Escherichia coli]